MAHHNHSHDCGCDADEHLVVEGTQDFLYSRIDKDNVVALNAAEGVRGSIVIRPWDQRMQEEEFLESDADEQLIIQIPFTGSIKLRSLIIKSGPAGYTPDKLKIFANGALDFDEALSTVPAQEIDLAISREAVEYALRPARFSNVQRLTLFFSSNHGEDTSRISFIGFKGEYSAISRDPVITVYESQANPADHNKIKGMDQAAHSSIG